MEHTFNELIGRVTDERRALADKIHAYLTKELPGIATLVSWGLPTYKLGKEWISLNYNKLGVVVYSCRTDLVGRFKLSHPELKMGKGCIHLNLKKPIPFDDLFSLLKEILSTSYHETTQKEK